MTDHTQDLRERVKKVIADAIYTKAAQNALWMEDVDMA